MSLKVFFSWQADSPSSTGRNTIERALEGALKKISIDTTIEEAERNSLEVDSDTRGIGGMPPIVETIFKKIDQAAIFVVDLTLTSTRLDGKRRSPNPNVLIEYGWALRSLGHGRLIGVINTFYSNVNAALPFDVVHLRKPHEFYLEENASEEDRRIVKKDLTKFFSRAIRTIINSGELSHLLPKPAPPRPFLTKAPMAGEARYRMPGKRLGVTDNIAVGGRDIFMRGGAAMWLRLMPSVDTGRDYQATAKKSQVTANLAPLGSFELGGYSSFRADDGYGSFSGFYDPDPTEASAILFDTGEIWSINTITMRGHNYIPFRKQLFSSALISYVQVISQTLGYGGDLRWIAGFDDVLDRTLAVEQRNTASILPTRAQCLTDTIRFEGEYDKGLSADDNVEIFYSYVRSKCGYGP